MRRGCQKSNKSKIEQRQNIRTSRKIEQVKKLDEERRTRPMRERSANPVNCAETAAGENNGGRTHNAVKAHHQRRRGCCCTPRRSFCACRDRRRRQTEHGVGWRRRMRFGAVDGDGKLLGGGGRGRQRQQQRSHNRSSEKHSRWFFSGVFAWRFGFDFLVFDFFFCVLIFANQNCRA